MRRTGTLRWSALGTALAGLLAAGMPAAGSAGQVTDDGGLGRTADEEAAVVEVLLEGRDELDRLVATGVDLDHSVARTGTGVVAHAVVTPNEAATLAAKGFRLGDVVQSAQDSRLVMLEREATIQEHIEANEAFSTAADDSTPPDVSDVKIVRADYFTQFGEGFLSVEAKWAQGQTASNPLVVERDSGPGTAFGSGGTQTITRFVDAGVYLYHRGADDVSTRPDRIRIMSPTGDVAIATVEDWLPLQADDPEEEEPLRDYMTSYLTPTQLYDRIHQLAAEFPQISEVVELPYGTNGYRRKAQTDFQARVVVEGPSSAAGQYTAVSAAFGPSASVLPGVAGTIAKVNDGSADPTLGCDPLVGFPAGAIALIDRGTCPFITKVDNAQDAGAVAAIVVNNVVGQPTTMTGSGVAITIPSMMIARAHGDIVKAGLPATGRLHGGPPSTSSRVIVESLAYGSEGGNDISVQMVDPGAPNQPLSVQVTGTDIRVNLATNASSELSSMAAQVVAAINASPDASTLVRAFTYRGNAGAGIVAATPKVFLTDYLLAPEDELSRVPHPVYALRIGKFRDGSRPGVLAYAQEHAREWVPPLVTIETAERLLRNYAIHGPTKQLVNNLDIWIAPSINPDGGHYSMYDFLSQRKNLVRYCLPTGSADPTARTAWGVDNNRNYTEYSLFDGYDGASTSCTSEVFAGPAELSEQESKNLDWLASRPNIQFSMNLHSSGNYFMWSPGAYRLPGRISAPRPTLAEESFFWGASSQILTEIKEHRGLSVTPARTGPISDVLYSAAGNSGDMLWYKYGIYAWNFEVGDQFQPPWEGEEMDDASAHQETMEFSNGLMELFRVAYEFNKDHTRPVSALNVTPSSTPGMVNLTFEVSEPAAVFYELDGDVPTYASTLYASAGVREGGELLTVPSGTTVHWFSVDSAGNIENNYTPDGSGVNYRKGVAALPG